MVKVVGRDAVDDEAGRDGFGFCLVNLLIVVFGGKVVFKWSVVPGYLVEMGFLLGECMSIVSAVLPVVTGGLLAVIDSPVFPKIAGKIEDQLPEVSGVSNLLCIKLDVKLLLAISECNTFCTLLTMSRMFDSLSTFIPVGVLSIF